MPAVPRPLDADRGGRWGGGEAGESGSWGCAGDEEADPGGPGERQRAAGKRALAHGAEGCPPQRWAGRGVGARGGWHPLRPRDVRRESRGQRAFECQKGLRPMFGVRCWARRGRSGVCRVPRWCEERGFRDVMAAVWAVPSSPRAVPWKTPPPSGLSVRVPLLARPRKLSGRSQIEVGRGLWWGC